MPSVVTAMMVGVILTYGVWAVVEVGYALLSRGAADV
jgi:hypothetical protein